MIHLRVNFIEKKPLRYGGLYTIKKVRSIRLPSEGEAVLLWNVKCPPPAHAKWHIQKFRTRIRAVAPVAVMAARSRRLCMWIIILILIILIILHRQS
jgi:hypothetical protein